MSTLKVPGAQLSYDVSGSGPLLILIPGARGTEESFRPFAHHLISQYEVVTYDRRGFSRSHLDGPADSGHRLATDADDVQCLIEHLADQPAIVFGSSSGAIVALEVLTHSPEQVQTLVANAPPAVFLLPDAPSWLAFFDGVCETYRKENPFMRLKRLADSISPIRSDSKTGGQQHISVDTHGHAIGFWRGRKTSVDAKKAEMPMERLYNTFFLPSFSVFLTLNECSHCSPQ